MFRRSAALLLLLIVTSGAVNPARAQQAIAAKPDRTRLWTILGAAAGAGLGFLIGFHIYDDATYSERKTLTATIVPLAPRLTSTLRPPSCGRPSSQ